MTTPKSPLRLPLVGTVALLSMCVAACGSAVGETAPSGEKNASVAASEASSIKFASAEAPVVVELFQSQGCSSCPPANANVNALAQRADVLALSFGVTYWDKLGWADSFAKPEYTARQWDYANHAKRGNVATPQIVINGGEATVVGSNATRLAAALVAAGSPKGGPAISGDKAQISLSGGKAAASIVWLVRYDPRERQVAIRAGENGGKTLPHRNTVQQLARLGKWTGTPVRFALPPASERGLQSAVLVQQGVGGPITAARKL